MEGVSTSDPKDPNPENESDIKETEDESSSRHLLEEMQRTFIHLEEGSKKHCFDPRALVEACACLKLEFDVWQQNDASEFATKLLDRLEISLKRWAPSHFQYMDHTFGLKQTKQKICKECGLKSNREEKLLNIDCQIRGKSDIQEALSAMTEVEIMEGSNKVFCDSCKKNTDTVLRTAISTLPNMLILSLKRFDLDYNTFETVKLNSRCAFGQTLDMKPYTLEGLEATEKSGEDQKMDDPAPMEAEIPSVDGSDTRSSLPDEDFEYRLAGVLVHAGVAQGGHYYSFIKDREGGSEDKWYRFDDEDVTPFDPALIETECFGGKVKKETKWPNGQVHAV
jgi:ubiquitin C-terminal hydrolase